MPENDQQPDTNGNGTILKGTLFGWAINLRGMHSITVVALLTLVGLLLFGANQLAGNVLSALDQRGVVELTSAINAQTNTLAEEHRDITSYMKGHTEEARAEHTTVREAIKHLDQTMQEQNFIILMTNEERKNVRLKMPPSLREKLIVGPKRKED